MTRLLRPLVLLAGLAAVLVSLLSAGPASAADSDDVPSRSPHVVIIGVPGLEWSDLTPTLTPAMWGLADEGSVGLLSVRGVPWVTCPADGWLTLSSGDRAQGLPPPRTGCPAELPYLTPEPSPSGGTVIAEMPTIRRDNAATLNGAEPGLLGDGVRCTAAVGRGGALGVADSGGIVNRYAEAPDSDLADLMAACPVTVVAAEQLEPEPRVRTQAVRAIDDTVARVLEALPADSTVLVLGISETGPRPRAHLHVAIASGPEYDRSWLTSQSTRRDRYVQLVDAAPTALNQLGGDRTGMSGAPMRAEGERATALADDVDWMIDMSTRARLQQDLMGPFDVVWGVTGVLALLVIGLGWAWARRRDASDWLRRLTMATVVVGAAYATVPVATFLANLVPWWSATWPGLSLALLVVVWVLVVVLLALLGPWRRAWLGPAALVAGVTAVVIGLDAVLGSNLEMDSLLGYSPLVAGRFTGLSNMAFAAFSVGVLVLLAVLAYGRSKTVGWAVILVGGVTASIVVASSEYGNDFGGTVALIPGLAVLAALVVMGRLTWGRVLMALLLAGVVVLAVSYVDYLRPEDERSHFGNFLGDLLSGDARELIERKVYSLFEVVFATPVTFAVPWLLLGLTILLVMPYGRGSTRLVDALETAPPLRAAMIAVAVCTLLGFALNDSGVALAGTALGTAVPLALLGLAWARRSRARRADA